MYGTAPYHDQNLLSGSGRGSRSRIPVPFLQESCILLSFHIDILHSVTNFSKSHFPGSAKSCTVQFLVKSRIQKIPFQTLFYGAVKNWICVTFYEAWFLTQSSVLWHINCFWMVSKILQYTSCHWRSWSKIAFCTLIQNADLNVDYHL